MIATPARPRLMMLGGIRIRVYVYPEGGIEVVDRAFTTIGVLEWVNENDGLIENLFRRLVFPAAREVVCRKHRRFHC